MALPAVDDVGAASSAWLKADDRFLARLTALDHMALLLVRPPSQATSSAPATAHRVMADTHILPICNLMAITTSFRSAARGPWGLSAVGLVVCAAIR